MSLLFTSFKPIESASKASQSKLLARSIFTDWGQSTIVLLSFITILLQISVIFKTR